jgi:hypothetical protein
LKTRLVFIFRLLDVYKDVELAAFSRITVTQCVFSFCFSLPFYPSPLTVLFFFFSFCLFTLFISFFYFFIFESSFTFTIVKNSITPPLSPLTRADISSTGIPADCHRIFCLRPSARLITIAPNNQHVMMMMTMRILDDISPPTSKLASWDRR